jgi:hypothetical protein
MVLAVQACLLQVGRARGSPQALLLLLGPAVAVGGRALGGHLQGASDHKGLHYASSSSSSRKREGVLCGSLGGSGVIGPTCCHMHAWVLPVGLSLSD